MSTTTAGIAGVDLSKWQGDVDFAKIRASGTTYVFVKATQGATGVDPDYARNIAAARAAGLVAGSYHFYVTADDAASQFANLAQHLDLKPGDLPPVIDIEVLSSSGSLPDLAAQLQALLDDIERAWNVRPILYSGENFANVDLKGFSRYPLWLAEYTDAPAPKLPQDWPAWTFWQYSQSGRVPGVDGAVDLDRFNGDQTQFDALRVS